VSESSKQLLDLEQRIRIAAHRKKPIELKKKRVVYAQGDQAGLVYYIVRGKVKMTVVSRRGKEAVVGIRGKGDFLGEGCLAGQSVRMATATTIEPVILVPIQKHQIVKLLREDTQFANQFIAYVLTRNIRSEEDLVDQLFNSSEKRLARALVLLAQYGKFGKLVKVEPRISQETLAEMIGTTRGRVSFFMNKFRKLGFIKYNGGLYVDNSLLNVILHD
jgi:CRP/FNR family cyclic AMP-dependent transcriptional regulator